MKTEFEKMYAGEEYFAQDEELIKLRTKTREITREYNSNPKPELLEKLFNQKLENVIIEPPFHCDYGINIKLGKNAYMNFGCTILDCAPVEIGENTMLAPNVQIYTARHPLDYKTRNALLEDAKPIKIGKNCWIGGNVVILPGITIGDGSVIGAGSVITKSIPENSLAVGNPCRVIRKIENED